MTDHGSISNYLAGKYGTDQDGLIWIGGQKDHWKGRTFAVVAEAADYAYQLDQRGGMGVYDRATTLRDVPTKVDPVTGERKVGGRGEIKDSATVYAFTIDGDIGEEGHKTEKNQYRNPADLAELEKIIVKAGLPTDYELIASGYGFYPRWHLAAPVGLRDDEELRKVQALFNALGAHLRTVAGKMGLHLDGVYDLSRVFRIPGTTNRKVAGQEQNCVVVRTTTARYTLDDLAACLTLTGVTDEQGDLFDEDTDDTPTALADTDGLRKHDGRWTRAQAEANIAAALAGIVNHPGPGRADANCPDVDRTGKRFNARLTTSAFRIGRWVRVGLLTRQEAEQRIREAVGHHFEPDRQDEASMESGLSGGIEAPPVWQIVEGTDGGAAVAHTEEEHLPSPGDPMRVARAVVEGMRHIDGVPTVTWWRGDFYRWDGGKWKPLDEATIDGILYRQTEHATYLVPAKGKDAEGTFEVRRWSPTQKKIGDLRNALAKGVLQRNRDVEPDDGRGTVSVTNGVFDVATRTLSAATPNRFNLVQLPFPYDPGATAPLWAKFLEEIAPGDEQIHDLLQEWFGEILFGGTRHHKILYVKGPKRCGKGTINRVLQALIGPEAVAAPSLASLAGNFGMQTLVGKSLASIADAKWKGANLPIACERLLNISGEDPVTIDRKYQQPWEGTLPTRFMMLSNDLPRPDGGSGALAGRFLIVHLRQTFFNREDKLLTDKLLTELPGVFNWALTGYDRLTARGYFVEPESSEDIKADVDASSSPVRQFVQAMCVETGEVLLDDLHAVYFEWAEQDQRTHVTKILDKNTFSRELREVVDGLTTARPRVNGRQTTMLKGVSITR